MVKAEVFGPGTYDSCANKVKRLTGILLIFHPGCGHCVQMRPECEKMKQNLSPGTRVMEVDGSEMSENRAMNEIPAVQKARGFPSLFLMKQGRPTEYKGQRNSYEMKHFFEKGMANKGIKMKTKRRKGIRLTRKRR